MKLVDVLRTSRHRMTARRTAWTFECHLSSNYCWDRYLKRESRKWQSRGSDSSGSRTPRAWETLDISWYHTKIMMSTWASRFLEYSKVPSANVSVIKCMTPNIIRLLCENRLFSLQTYQRAPRPGRDALFIHSRKSITTPEKGSFCGQEFPECMEPAL